MKKKLLSVILTVSMTAALLAGCGSAPAAEAPAAEAPAAEAPAAEEVPAAEEAAPDTSAATGEDPQMEKTIKILSIWAEDNDNGVLVNKICNDYKTVNPKFNYEYEYVSSDDLKQKIATLAASNDLPDLFVYEAGKPIVDLIEADQIMDVGAILDEYGCADKLTPSAESLLKTLSGTDKLYDLPLGLNVEGFWYNKALFEEAGVTAPETWDEFEEVLKTLNDAGIQPLSCGAADKWGATRIMNGYLVRIAGADAMKKAANGEAKYTDEAYVAAAQKLQDWANAGYFGKGVTTVDMNTAGTMLMTGDAAIFYNGSWFTQNLTDTTANLAGEDGIGFFNVPVVDASISDAGSYSMNCGNIICVGKEKYDEATGWFLKYFVENIGNIAMEEQGTVKGYTYDVAPKNNSGYTQLVLDKLSEATSAFTWYESTMGSEVSTVAQENVQTLLNGDMTADEYMESIQNLADLQ